ncbi:zinc ribbon domain-containing protein, partial [Halorubrum sp. AJ67]|uniref:zinc ribbon domain-containing protein n=1 Tax=Halorubrum sp. AJ67 TaxID=1173487 RepID=UPI001E325CC0
PPGGAAVPRPAPGNAGDINVNVTLDAPNAGPDEDEEAVSVTRETADDAEPSARKTSESPGAKPRENVCGGCGENVPSDHVYCPNCGEKQSHRAFCECGDELRTDWAFCPGCGRRTPAADVLNDR